MAQNDSFISEVTDEVRRERLFGFLRRYGWIGAVAVVALVGGAAVYEWRQAEATKSAQSFGDSLMAALQSDDAGAALAKLTGSDSQKALARMAVAASAAQEGKGAEALADLKAVSDDAALPRSLRDMAALKAVMIAGDGMDAAQRKAELDRLAQPGAPFRALAMEQQAVALASAGDRDGAIAKAREILNEAGITPGLQQRAGELIVALGGDPAASGAAATEAQPAPAK